eukprot:scaffold17189_cov28-Tisochrysis_lutea.AAC.1
MPSSYIEVYGSRLMPISEGLMGGGSGGSVRRLRISFSCSLRMRKCAPPTLHALPRDGGRCPAAVRPLAASRAARRQPALLAHLPWPPCLACGPPGDVPAQACASLHAALASSLSCAA